MDIESKILTYDINSLRDIKVYNGLYTELIRFFAEIQVTVKAYPEDFLLATFGNNIVEEIDSWRGVDVDGEALRTIIKVRKKLFDDIIKTDWHIKKEEEKK